MGKWEPGTWKKDYMGGGNMELGRRITWEVGTGNWEEGLHGNREQGTGKNDYMGKWEQGGEKKDYM